MKHIWILTITGMLAFTACATPVASPSPTSTATVTPSLTSTISPTKTPSPTPTAAPPYEPPEGATYQEIAMKTGASTATISRVNRALHYGADGYTLVLAQLDKEV